MVSRITGNAKDIATPASGSAMTCPFPEIASGTKGSAATGSAHTYAPAMYAHAHARETSDPQHALRRSWVSAVRAWDAAIEKAERRGLLPGDAGWPRCDWTAFADLRCGARTRAGNPCKRRDIHGSGRCPLHGGLSTGPRTADGKARSALNGRCLKRTRPELHSKPHETVSHRDQRRPSQPCSAQRRGVSEPHGRL